MLNYRTGSGSDLAVSVPLNQGVDCTVMNRLHFCCRRYPFIIPGEFIERFDLT